jgi:hypothetical protein
MNHRWSAILTVAIVLSLLSLSERASSAAQIGQSIPSFLPRTLHAKPFAGQADSAVPDLQPAGTLVPTGDVTPTVSDSSHLRFGLAFLPTLGQTYPAISTDGGMTWRLDGPLFHVNAADGAAVVSSVGTLGLKGAYFWGQGATASGSPTTRVNTGGVFGLTLALIR